MEKDKGFIVLSSRAGHYISTTGAINLRAKLQKENPRAFVLYREEKEITMLRVTITSELKTVEVGPYLGHYFECESK